MHRVAHHVPRSAHHIACATHHVAHRDELLARPIRVIMKQDPELKVRTSRLEVERFCNQLYIQTSSAYRQSSIVAADVSRPLDLRLKFLARFDCM